MSRQGKISAIIEARMTSTRLPGKVLLEAVGKPMLQLMIERISRAAAIDNIIIATTTNDSDDPIVELAKTLSIDYFRGSEHDVLGRVVGSAQAHNVDVIVEIPGDCPLIDPAYVDLCVNEFIEGDADYVSSALSNSFPHGSEAQVFLTKTLEDVASRTDDPTDHEHVSLFMYNNPKLYKIQAINAPIDIARPDVHLTLDEQKDYEFISHIFEHFYLDNPNFTLQEILDLLNSNDCLARLNKDIQRTII